MVIVIHGPPGCGKTRNRQRLADYNGCATIHDVSGDTPPTLDAINQIGGDHLILAQTGEAEEMKSLYWRAPGGVRLTPYVVAAKRAGITA